MPFTANRCAVDLGGRRSLFPVSRPPREPRSPAVARHAAAQVSHNYGERRRKRCDVSLPRLPVQRGCSAAADSPPPPHAAQRGRRRKRGRATARSGASLALAAAALRALDLTAAMPSRVEGPQRPGDDRGVRADCERVLDRRAEYGARCGRAPIGQGVDGTGMPAAAPRVRVPRLLHRLVAPRPLFASESLPVPPLCRRAGTCLPVVPAPPLWRPSSPRERLFARRPP